MVLRIIQLSGSWNDVTSEICSEGHLTVIMQSRDAKKFLCAVNQSLAFIISTSIVSVYELRFFFFFFRVYLQVPVAPLERVDVPPLNQMWQTESHEDVDFPPERGIPTLITWNYGGSDVAVEGSWDNWKSR